jgi:hypothetical protein
MQRPQLRLTSPPWRPRGPRTRRSARTLEDLVPADNAMSMDAAIAWSRQDWEMEEAE